MVCDPLNLYDVAPDVDGAAALILTRADLVKARPDHPLVRVCGSAAGMDALSLHDRTDPLAFHAARDSRGPSLPPGGHPAPGCGLL